ncbi:FAD-dependent monooxygenase [Streptomyces sp. NBC_01483]|uniref:FAD-dependent monooxygenase n=1 Tax=Streptomyces sp. NBC_01483 TaxID=2903883 RepID=UPI003FCEA88E
MAHRTSDLLGDSAHAMVPFQAQGAAQAVRDAAVLGDALAGATPTEVRDALDPFARRRLSTATNVQACSAWAGEDHHLPDIPELFGGRGTRGRRSSNLRLPHE